MGIEHLDDTWISEDGDDVFGVQVSKDGRRLLSLFVNVMEFVREEPLQSRLRAAIAAAVGAVPGVQQVEEEDRETWAVTGGSGGAVIRAVAAVLEQHAEELTSHVAARG